MKIAMPVKTDHADAPLAPLFGNAKFFAFCDTESVTIEAMPQHGGRDVARTLIAVNVEVLITSHLGFQPFVLLKSYGVRVYYAGDNRILISEALKALHEGELVEVSSENFMELLGEEPHSPANCCGGGCHISA
jgi:predicted Fe-Mo cluster-binding NifX family protein